MNILDEKQQWCDTYLFREHCTYHNNTFVKDLTRLGRDMRDVIIIDNSPMSYQFQPENAIPSISWYEDKNDTQLLDWIPMLKQMAEVDDVRPFLSQSTKNNVLDIAYC
jgi:RNA polymerase II subunit A small phosphatase-like protein